MRFRLSKFYTALPDAGFRQVYDTRFKPCGSRFYAALPDADYRQAYGIRFKPCGSRFYNALPDTGFRQMYGTRTVGNGLARSERVEFGEWRVELVRSEELGMRSCRVVKNRHVN